MTIGIIQDAPRHVATGFLVTLQLIPKHGRSGHRGTGNTIRVKFGLALGAVLLCCLSARGETMKSGVLMSGTRYQTPYFIKQGDKSGPTVVVVGGVHGDEVAGYQAALLLKSWHVEEGTLVLVPQAHIEAIRRGVRAYPRNMNRLFPGKANGDAMEKLAFEIWSLIKSSRPQLLLTLHESRGFYVQDHARYGQTFTFDFEELRPQFAKVADTVNESIAVPLNKFQVKVEAFETCPTYCAWKWLHVPATSIETARTLPLALRVEMQLKACGAFFDSYGLRATRPQ